MNEKIIGHFNGLLKCTVCGKIFEENIEHECKPSQGYEVLSDQPNNPADLNHWLKMNPEKRIMHIWHEPHKFEEGWREYHFLWEYR